MPVSSRYRGNYMLINSKAISNSLVQNFLEMEGDKWNNRKRMVTKNYTTGQKNLMNQLEMFYATSYAKMWSIAVTKGNSRKRKIDKVRQSPTCVGIDTLWIVYI